MLEPLFFALGLANNGILIFIFLIRGFWHNPQSETILSSSQTWIEGIS
jgi:hypothetical protein